MNKDRIVIFPIQDVLYHILKIIITIGIRIYYKEIRVKNRQFIEGKGAKIIISNHPNTLMDAWLVSYACKERVYYMAKATFFSNPFKKWFLGSLGMIPVNRTMDGKNKIVSNEDTFEACYQLLEEGKTLLIFPEGTSYKERLLRQLKSGTSRIALTTEKRNEGKLGLKIIPVGLNYIQPEKFRSRVQVNIGQPVYPGTLLADYKENSMRAVQRLTEELRVSLTRLMVQSEEKEEEKLVEEIVDILSSEYTRTEKKGVERDVSLMKSVFEQINAFRVAQPWKIDEVKTAVEQLQWRMRQLNIKSDFLDRKYRTSTFVRQLLFSTFILAMGSPIYFLGVFHNYIQYKLVDILVRKLVKDVEYYAPVAILFGIVMYPAAYVGFYFLFQTLMDPLPWVNWVYVLTLPFLGLGAYYYYDYYKHLSFKRNFIFLMRKHKNDIEEIKAEREKLRSLVFE